MSHECVIRSSETWVAICCLKIQNFRSHPRLDRVRICILTRSPADLYALKSSLIAQLVKNPPAMQETPVQFLDWEIPWRRDRLLTPVFLGFPCGLAGNESACNVGDLGLIPGLGWSPGEGKGYPLQYSGLENSMDCIVHGGHKELDMTERLLKFEKLWYVWQF